MSDLALEIKKLADKYRNSKKTGLLDVDDFGCDEDAASEVDLSTVSNDDYSNDFSSERLDFLEQEVDDLSDLGDLESEIESNEGGALTKGVVTSVFDVAESASEEVTEDVFEDAQEEIQIADFINPGADVAKNSGYEDAAEDGEEIFEGNRGAVSESLRLISRNLRDLKMLLRS